MRNVSIVIVNWNGINHLKKLLPSLRKLTYPNLEIIVVDNKSTDGSVEYIRQNDPHIHIIENNQNDGFAQGNNIGVSKVHSKYVLLLNNDTLIIQSDMIQKLVEVLEKDQTVAVVQPKIFRMGYSDVLDSVGAFYTNTGFLYHFGYLHRDGEKYNKAIPLFSAKGACILMNKRIIDEIGLFDPFYQSYFEETDFCHRAWLAGYQVLYEPTVSIEHYIGGTSNSMDNGYIQYHSFKNRIHSYIKNLGYSELIKMLPIHFAICIAIIFAYLLKGNRSVSLSIMRAFWWNLVNISKTLKQRKRIQNSLRKKPDSELFKVLKKNQPFAYYWALFNNRLEKYE